MHFRRIIISNLLIVFSLWKCSAGNELSTWSRRELMGEYLPVEDRSYFADRSIVTDDAEGSGQTSSTESTPPSRHAPTTRHPAHPSTHAAHTAHTTTPHHPVTATSPSTIHPSHRSATTTDTPPSPVVRHGDEPDDAHPPSQVRHDLERVDLYGNITHNVTALPVGFLPDATHQQGQFTRTFSGRVTVPMGSLTTVHDAVFETTTSVATADETTIGPDNEDSTTTPAMRSRHHTKPPVDRYRVAPTNASDVLNINSTGRTSRHLDATGQPDGEATGDYDDVIGEINEVVETTTLETTTTSTVPTTTPTQPAVPANFQETSVDMMSIVTSNASSNSSQHTENLILPTIQASEMPGETTADVSAPHSIVPTTTSHIPEIPVTSTVVIPSIASTRARTTDSGSLPAESSTTALQGTISPEASATNVTDIPAVILTCSLECGPYQKCYNFTDGLRCECEEGFIRNPEEAGDRRMRSCVCPLSKVFQDGHCLQANKVLEARIVLYGAYNEDFLNVSSQLARQVIKELKDEMELPLNHALNASVTIAIQSFTLPPRIRKRSADPTNATPISAHSFIKIRGSHSVNNSEVAAALHTLAARNLSLSSGYSFNRQDVPLAAYDYCARQEHNCDLLTTWCRFHPVSARIDCPCLKFHSPVGPFTCVFNMTTANEAGASIQNENEKLRITVYVFVGIVGFLACALCAALLLLKMRPTKTRKIAPPPPRSRFAQSELIHYKNRLPRPVMSLFNTNAEPILNDTDNPVVQLDPETELFSYHYGRTDSMRLLLVRTLIPVTAVDNCVWLLKYL
ncbi:uncharacterized protein LOC129598221 isoform X2 [Paramacrobiotus metropolitanus]|uniref:uncharacterized protein LOC129598221 isoform X2 n=1 Tax=Paramacrobiotus metropolitanus TaxID=2943436 RepID=UPI002445ADBB|nr:uncharacterized protein LOC129598221 isoform X2 [Paramacrobiotus metropolitanus]